MYMNIDFIECNQFFGGLWIKFSDLHLSLFFAQFSGSAWFSIKKLNKYGTENGFTIKTIWILRLSVFCFFQLFFSWKSCTISSSSTSSIFPFKGVLESPSSIQLRQKFIKSYSLLLALALSPLSLLFIQNCSAVWLCAGVFVGDVFLLFFAPSLSIVCLFFSANSKG